MRLGTRNGRTMLSCLQNKGPCVNWCRLNEDHIFSISDQFSVAMVNIQDVLAMGFEEWLLNATDSSIASNCF